VSTNGEDRDVLVHVEGLEVELAGRTILDGVDLEIRRGEIVAIAGGSGSGKSVLIKTILGLLHPKRGRLRVMGVNPFAASEEELGHLKQRWGAAFQYAALFTALSVRENVEVPLREQLDLPDEAYRDLADLRLRLVGLSGVDAEKRPGELSGGMRKRASIARALAVSPELLFLDEPTSGLDPVSAASLDDLIGRLTRGLDLTVLMVTHDLGSIFGLADRTAVLADGRIEALGPPAELSRSEHPWVRECFGGRRGRAAQWAIDEGENPR